jgi:hypothetical protein
LLRHEGKFAENRIDVEVSTLERVEDRKQIDGCLGLM